MEQKLVNISSIITTRSVRQDLGDIDGLAESIKRYGLLHPVVLYKDKSLISGHRRIAAFKQLKRARISATIIDDFVDVERLLKEENCSQGDAVKHAQYSAMLDENSQRKGFTPSEAVAVGERLEAIVRRESKAAQIKGGDAGRKPGKGRKKAPPRPDLASRKLREAKHTRETTSRVAKAVNMSGRSYERAKEVVAAAEANPKAYRAVKEKMDRTGKVSPAHKELQVAKQKRTLGKRQLALPKGPFDVLAIDPPWDFDGNKGTRTIELPYPGMSFEKICKIDIPSICAKRCVVFLWTVNGYLMKMPQVLEAWGLEYRTCLTWDKGKIGVGKWLRGQTEHCLIATRGKPVTPTLSAQSTILRAKGGEHSAKPDAFYKMVEELYPGSTKAEIFSRTSRKGWAAFGDETDKLKPKAR